MLTAPQRSYASQLLQTAQGWAARSPNLLQQMLDGEVAPWPARADSWANDLTGIGTSRDKTTYTHFQADQLLTWAELQALYHNDDMASRICDEVPEQALREGFGITVKDQPEVGAQILDVLEGLGAEEAYVSGASWGRLYGGAGILVGADDGQDVSEPLNEKAIRSIDFLSVVDRYSLFPVDWYLDPRDPKFGQPSRYRILTPTTAAPYAGTDPSAIALQSGVTIHETRLILFGGARTDMRRKRSQNGWDDSVLQRCFGVLQNFANQWGSVATLMSDANQAVMGVQGLYDMIASGNKAAVQQRAQLIDMSRSSGRMVLIDKDAESFERKPTQFSGLADLLDRTMNRLAAAARMPVTVLMGQAPAGLNATGASDIRAWYDQVRSWQRKTLKPRLKRLVDLIMLVKGSPTAGAIPEYEITFPPLWQMTAEEKANVRKLNADIDHIYLTDQVLLPEEIAVNRFRATGYDYSGDMTIDLEVRERMLKGDLEERLIGPDPAAEQPVPPVNPDPMKPGAMMAGEGGDGEGDTTEEDPKAKPAPQA